MWIDYRQAIGESAADLLKLERRYRGAGVGDRVKMLRLLKTEAYPSQRQLATVLGYTERQLRRWWRLYARSGLTALLHRAPPGGRPERLDAGALAALEAEMKAGRIGRLRDAQRFLAERCGVPYHGVSGLSRLFQRHKIKLKTGRRRHRRAEAEAQAAFKKTSPST
jgi:transposase